MEIRFNIATVISSNVKLEKIFPHISVKKLLVRHDNAGIGAGWHLDKVSIQDILL